MANDVNTVTISGNLVRDAEIRYTNSGFPIVGFSIASNRSKKVNEEWETETHYFDCTMFGRENMAQYLVKGKKVFISGKLEQQRWEKDGQKRSAVKIIAETIVLGGERGDHGSATPQQPKSQQSSNDDVWEDDLPF